MLCKIISKKSIFRSKFGFIKKVRLPWRKNTTNYKSASSSGGQKIMIFNISQVPLDIKLNSGNSVYIPPRSASEPISNEEIEGNDQLGRLKGSRMAVVKPAPTKEKKDDTKPKGKKNKG